ncbi:uncharacterized protein LOC124266507 [Haliotis rubra]|uniref:uncharacterized protein LOC124266507 n=1 Tax=Haliotis rubra TaxID=36100 RepID=UPI001EE5C84F|nr:uncharacterized protein LOC124266507 [Haliotis rubra]
MLGYRNIYPAFPDEVPVMIQRLTNGDEDVSLIGYSQTNSSSRDQDSEILFRNNWVFLRSSVGSRAFLSLSESTRIVSELAHPCTSGSPSLQVDFPQDFFGAQSESQADMVATLQDLIIAMKEAKTSVNRANIALRRSDESARFKHYFQGSQGDPNPEVSSVFKSFKQNIKIDYNQTSKMWLNLNRFQQIVNVRHSTLTQALTRCKDKLVVVLCKLQTVFPEEDMPMVSEDDTGDRMTLVQFRKYFRNTINLYKHYKAHFKRQNVNC